MEKVRQATVPGGAGSGQAVRLRRVGEAEAQVYPVPGRGGDRSEEERRKDGPPKREAHATARGAEGSTTA